MDSLGRHVCWAFNDSAEFALRAADYLGEGMARGYRVCYIAPGDPGQLLDEISSASGFREAVDSGAAQFISVDSAYHGFTSADPAQQLRHYAQATERALADGHTGLRVAANVTSRVLTPDALSAFARYEHLVDRFMIEHPFSAMCGYDRAVLSAEQVARLACMHPQASPDATPMRLYASTDQRIAAVLAGEIDIASHRLFEEALEHAEPPAGHGPITIDATALEFIDHRGLSILDGFLSRRAATAVLRCRPDSPLATLTQLLCLPNVRLEAG
jgi:anti-anti-sigma regulatory factor